MMIILLLCLFITFHFVILQSQPPLERNLNVSVVNLISQQNLQNVSLFSVCSKVGEYF